MTTPLVLAVLFAAYQCAGRMIQKAEDSELDLQTPSNVNVTIEKETELNDLLNSILEAIEQCRSENAAELVDPDNPPPCAEDLESLVLDLSTDKRKVLAEILNLILSPKNYNETMIHKAQQGLNPLVERKVEVFTLPPGQMVNVQDLLRFLLESTSTTPAPALDHLQKLIYDSKDLDIQEDPIVQMAVRKVFEEAKQNKRKFFNFA